MRRAVRKPVVFTFAMALAHGDATAQWAPDEAARQRIMIENPSELFGFNRSADNRKERRNHATP